MNTFESIENVLKFHHTTTSAPMSVVLLLKKAGIQRADLTRVLQVWPSAYKVTRIRISEFIECADSPYDLESRLKIFQEKLRSGVLGDISNTVSCHTSSMPSTPSIKSNASSPCKIIKSSNKKPTVLNMEQLLKRVAEKNAANQLAKEQQSSKRTAFYQSQVPAVTSILQTLAKLGKSFSSTEVVRKVQGSLKSRLGTEEIVAVLELIATQMPAFCRIVEAGNVKCIHLMNPSSANSLEISPEAPLAVAVAAN